ncbi:MAG: hypothetical protein KatS3mg102_0860 [Planctomycetota bacterium]|nr:MAG: hypothetical protein KatS3mg102_0860 [Planctomycetota bacterium]
MPLPVTDPPPRAPQARELFERSERERTIALPPQAELARAARRLAAALRSGEVEEVGAACSALVELLAVFYAVPPPRVEVLQVRPRTLREGWEMQLHGEYDPESATIRVWMRTAVRRQLVAFPTLCETLLHEFCHHLDCVRWGDTWHTRGFYERVRRLYTHALRMRWVDPVWRRGRGGRWWMDLHAMRVARRGAQGD